MSVSHEGANLISKFEIDGETSSGRDNPRRYVFFTLKTLYESNLILVTFPFPEMADDTRMRLVESF